jgi:uncharacterized cofD-like protein
VLLARLPALERHERLGGHTGGNLLLSMMEQYSGDFLAAVDGLSALLGCRGRVWPITVQSATLCAAFGDGTSVRGEPEIDAALAAGRRLERLWIEPSVALPPAVDAAIRRFDAVIVGPGSFYTSLMPPLLVDGVREAIAQVRGPVILIANLLTEGRGMTGFSAAEAARRVGDALGRPVDVVIANTARPPEAALARYAAEHKEPLAVGTLDEGTELVTAPLWSREIARHDRRRLGFALWSVLSRRLL